jgi:hypothetical protein
VPRLRRPTNLSRELVQLCDAIDAALNDVPAFLRNGSLLAGEDGEGILIAAGTSLPIAHNLGRVPRYWLVLRNVETGSGGAQVLEEIARDASYLTLSAPARAQKVTLWVA